MTNKNNNDTGSSAQLSLADGNHESLQATLTGDWLLGNGLPDADQVTERFAGASRLQRLEYATPGLGHWDSGLMTFLVNIQRNADDAGIAVDSSGLPEGAQKLLHLAFAVKEREGARRVFKRESFFEQVGKATDEMWQQSVALVSFLGELMQSFARLLKGKANFQRSDLLVVLQEAGAEALPIVSLISFLIGMIFAFVGVIQLQALGAGIYTADLVAVAMVREMSAIMTGIIMAGRTGASYAAQLGTMKVNEEIDALTTMGIDPIDFLVLPRVIALIIMMPFLTMYGSLMGILGGMLVGVSMLDVNVVQYVEQTKAAVGLNDLFSGLFKAVVYGTLVATAGTQQGIACGNSAMAVGQATTKAVVMGIVLIVVSASILTVIYINLGI